MRYIANSDGYLRQVSFGADIVCNDQECTQYTGAVPADYSSLEDWYRLEGEKLYRWKIVSGQLMLDSDAKAPRDTAYPPFFIQTGTDTISFGSSYQESTVRFPTAFKSTPIVIVSQVFDDKNLTIQNSYVSASEFRVRVAAGFTSSGTRTFSWLAIGK